MILYPAIDLKDGQCVRLLHGDMDKVTVFNDSPTDQAARFEAARFEDAVLRWTYALGTLADRCFTIDLR